MTQLVDEREHRRGLVLGLTLAEILLLLLFLLLLALGVRIKLLAVEIEKERAARADILAKKPSKGAHGRSAISGRFVTTKHAKSNPRTTVIERIGSGKRPGKSPGGTKGRGKK